MRTSKRCSLVGAHFMSPMGAIVTALRFSFLISHDDEVNCRVPFDLKKMISEFYIHKKTPNNLFMPPMASIAALLSYIKVLISRFP